MGKKYELTDETIEYDGRKLHRIKALTFFGNVKAGEIGGWIESESNLSQEGNAWVFDNAKVYGNAQVCDNAKVYDNAIVHDNAKIYGNAKVHENSLVYNNAKVYEDARIFGKARVYGNARVYGKPWAFGNARAYDDAEIYASAWLCGNAEVGDNADISEREHILDIGFIGSRARNTTFFRTKNKEISVICGCFKGSIDDFEKAIEETHGDNKHGRVYKLAIAMAKEQIELGKFY